MRSDSSGNDDSPGASRFHEEQVLQPRRRRWIVALLPATVTALAAGQMRLGHLLGKYSLSTGGLLSMAVLLWAVYVWLSRVRLVTDVDDDGVSIRVRGLSRHHRIPLSKVTSAVVVTFNPDKDFGGYGIRHVGRGRAYVGDSVKGVRMELSGGGFAVIGSARPEALLIALRAHRPRGDT